MTYHIKMQGLVGDDAIMRLARGWRWEGRPVKPTTIDRLAKTERNTWIEMVVPETRPRALKAAGEAPVLGLYGFGAAAHLIAQVALAQGRTVFAFTRQGDDQAQAHARALGCDWAGSSEEPPPWPLDAAILFAPVGSLVPRALARVRKGGRVVCAGTAECARVCRCFQLSATPMRAKALCSTP